MNRAPYIIKSMQNEFSLMKRYKKFVVIDLLAKNIKLWQDLSFYICLIQNILILLTLQDDHNFIKFEYGYADSSAKDSSEDDNGIFNFSGAKEVIDNLKLLLLYLQYLQIFFSLLVAIFFFMREFPYLYSIAIHEINKQNFDGWTNLKINLFKSFIFSNKIIFNPTLLYNIAYFTFAFLGILNPVFVSILLLDLFRRYPILRTILDSLWRPKKQIILTIMLLLLITYYFSLIFYYNFFYMVDPICSSLYSCYFYILD